MLKNENGCPCMNVPRGTTNGQTGATENNTAPPARTGSGCCGGTGDCRDSMPLAYVYSPDQKFRLLYSAPDALKHATLFEELYKPMKVYGRE